MSLKLFCILLLALSQFFVISDTARLRTDGNPVLIEYFYSHSFVPDALKIDYEVQDDTEVYYNVTAFRPFPGRLLMNFFVRKYAAVKGEPSADVFKKRNLDFCKTIDILRNMTNDAETKPFLLQDTFVTSCPLINGFYFVQSGIIPSGVIPLFMGPGRYVVCFELIQVMDELVKLMNLRFIIVVDENVHANRNPNDNSDGSNDENVNEDTDKKDHKNSNDKNEDSIPNVDSNGMEEGNEEGNENSGETKNSSEPSNTNDGNEEGNENSGETKNSNEPSNTNHGNDNENRNSNENPNEDTDPNETSNLNSNEKNDDDKNFSSASLEHNISFKPKYKQG